MEKIRAFNNGEYVNMRICHTIHTIHTIHASQTHHTWTPGTTLVLQLDGIATRDTGTRVVVALRRATEARARRAGVALPELSAVVLQTGLRVHANIGGSFI